MILIVVNSSMIINLNVYTRTFFLFSSSTWLIGLEKKVLPFTRAKDEMSTGRGRSEKAFSTLLLRMYTLHLDFSAVLKVHTTPRAFCCQCLWKVYMFLSFTILLKFTLPSKYSIQAGNLIYNVAF